MVQWLVWLAEISAFDQWKKAKKSLSSTNEPKPLSSTNRFMPVTVSIVRATFLQMLMHHLKSCSLLSILVTEYSHFLNDVKHLYTVDQSSNLQL